MLKCEILYPPISTTPLQLGPPRFYPLIGYWMTVNKTLLCPKRVIWIVSKETLNGSNMAVFWPQSARTTRAVPPTSVIHLTAFQPRPTLFAYYSHLYISGWKIQKVWVYLPRLCAKENLALFPYTNAFGVAASSAYLRHWDLWSWERAVPSL